MSCIFCKIINKQAPTEIVQENNQFIAFKDINPKANIHFLITPKKHIDSVLQLEEQDSNLIGQMILFAKNVAKDNNIDGYKLLINVGRKAGQIVDHLHLHLLSGFSDKGKELL